MQPGVDSSRLQVGRKALGVVEGGLTAHVVLEDGLHLRLLDRDELVTYKAPYSNCLGKRKKAKRAAASSSPHPSTQVC